MSDTLNLTGLRVGLLTVLSREGHTLRSGRPVPAWRCRCDCGQEILLSSVRLRRGNKKACGINGHRYTYPLHDVTSNERTIYGGMLQRCYNPKSTAFVYYGLRGIKVCARWRNSFTQFLSDMGPRPSDRHSVERRDNDKGYNPKNCYWGTYKEQANNKRNQNVKITVDGRTLTVQQYCDEIGLDAGRVRKRLRRGWSVEAALTTSAIQKGNQYPADWLDGSAFKKTP